MLFYANLFLKTIERHHSLPAGAENQGHSSFTFKSGTELEKHSANLVQKKGNAD